MTVAVVIDTNVWVSAFLNPDGFPARLILAGKTGNFSIISSLPLVDELQEVLLRPRIMKIRRATLTDVEVFMTGVVAVVQLVPVSGDLSLCRDPDDDIILETAIRGRATYVVSRDEDVTRDLDLIHVLRERGIEIITVQRLIDRLQLDVA
ncbi:MAG: putative toxin-antitoxin system toxin component, PIN family [Anaerolinea sp.]|nr:putative toxin-antitoxin system toxin component, PIN family [Anaerolinea sp.]